MAEEPIKYIVQIGDCISSIATDHGHFWKTLWDLPQNQSLRDERKDPNILQEEDVVYVPEIRIRQEEGDTEKRHRFVRKGIPSRFNVRFLSEGTPRANVPYNCTIEGKSYKGKTNSEGVVSLPVSPITGSGVLILTDNGVPERYVLQFGHLDPISSVKGIQQRLKQLGYHCPVTGEMCDTTRDALQAYRLDRGLDPSTDDLLDDTLRGQLQKDHDKT